MEKIFSYSLLKEWRKNYSEMKQLVDLFVNKTPYCKIALNALKW